MCPVMHFMQSPSPRRSPVLHKNALRQLETSYTQRDLRRFVARNRQISLISIDRAELGPWIGAQVGDLILASRVGHQGDGLTLWFPETISYAEAARRVVRLFGWQGQRPRFMKSDGTDIRPFRSKAGLEMLAAFDAVPT